MSTRALTIPWLLGSRSFYLSSLLPYSSFNDDRRYDYGTIAFDLDCSLPITLRHTPNRAAGRRVGICPKTLPARRFIWKTLTLSFKQVAHSFRAHRWNRLRPVLFIPERHNTVSAPRLQLQRGRAMLRGRCAMRSVVDLCLLFTIGAVAVLVLAAI